ncbi:hypothetical protein B0H13DRAFT_2663048, partial [Mycena leptocephala]
GANKLFVSRFCQDSIHSGRAHVRLSNGATSSAIQRRGTPCAHLGHRHPRDDPRRPPRSGRLRLDPELGFVWTSLAWWAILLASGTESRADKAASVRGSRCSCRGKLIGLLCAGEHITSEGRFLPFTADLSAIPSCYSRRVTSIGGARRNADINACAGGSSSGPRARGQRALVFRI